MSNDLLGTGAPNVNGHVATAIRYELTGAGDGPQRVELRFVNGGGRTIARTIPAAAEARQLVGDRSYVVRQPGATMGGAAAPASVDGSGSVSRGELRGESLHFHHGTVPREGDAQAENAIRPDGDSRDTGRRRSLTSVQKVRQQPTTNGKGMAKADGGDGSPEKDVESADHAAASVPESVSRRFVQIGDRFYFPDRTIAFIDHGAKLRAVSNNLQVAYSLVAIAEDRAWTGDLARSDDAWHRGARLQARRTGTAVAWTCVDAP